MNGPGMTRPLARNAAESAYPDLWRGLVAAWAPAGAPRHGNRLWDYSGNGNHGTFQYGAGWTAGHHGHGVLFDGLDDDVIGDTPGKNFPVGNQSRTVACWVKSVGPWTQDLGLLHWGRNSASPAKSNYQLVAGTGGKILWGNGYDGASIVAGNKIVSDGKWHHVAGTYTEGVATIYIDGCVDAVGFHTAATLLDHSWRWGRFQTNLGPWFGSMSECIVYRRALLPLEVGMLFCGASPFFNRTGRKCLRHRQERAFCSVSM